MARWVLWDSYLAVWCCVMDRPYEEEESLGFAAYRKRQSCPGKCGSANHVMGTMFF